MSPAIETTVPALARMTQIRSRFGVEAATAASEASSFASLLGATETAASTSPTGAATGADVIDAASDYLGVPYVWGGTDPSKGLDCSGFVQRTYQDVGVELPRVARDQATQGTEVPSLDQAKPGDLIAFGQPVDHISLYMGDGKIMHAPRTGDVVKVADIHRPIATIRRIVPESTAATATASTGTAGLGTADAVALRQLLQLVSRQLTTNATASYGAGSSIGLGFGVDDQALG